MKNASNKIWQKVRFFLRQISWKKLLTFSFFVVIATFLWFMQISNKRFDTSISIPIKYISVPDSIIFQDSLPSHIDIRLSNYGYAMFGYSLRKTDTLKLDVSAVINSNSSRVLQGNQLRMNIENLLNNNKAALFSSSPQIISYSPDLISFNYSTLEHKVLPLIFDGQINLRPGYFLKNEISFYPDSIMAYGAKVDLDKLIYAYTTNDTVNGLNSDKVLSYKLSPVAGVRFSPNEVTVNVEVEPYTQKNVEIAAECLNLPENLRVKFFPSKVKLSFFVGVSAADSIQASDFVVATDYNAIKDSKQISVPVRIISSPSYARNLTITPPNVEYIFEYKNIN